MGSRKLLIELHVTLGLPKVDRTKTRQMVRAYFELYRSYKLLLAMDNGFEPHREPMKALSGYKNAMDPNLIHAPYSFGSGPRGGGFMEDGMETREDRERVEFVRNVERKVSALHDYQRDIIRHQFMQRETPGKETKLPSDVESHQYLRSTGWYVSERYYDEEKAKAIQTLAEAFRIVQYEL